MLPIIAGREGDLIKIEVTINLSGSMLEAEESILRGVNAVGTVATGEASLSGVVATGRDWSSVIALMIARLVPPLAGYPH